MSHNGTGNGDSRAPRGPVGGPVRVAWREGTLTRAKELEALVDWLRMQDAAPGSTDGLLQAIDVHLNAARDAACVKAPPWKRADGASLERAMSNLSAAEADLLQVAPPGYVLGQVPCLLNQVQSHLGTEDPRRKEFERIAGVLGVAEPPGSGHPHVASTESTKVDLVEAERSKIASISRGAGSAALREQLRVRSFRNVLAATTAAMALLAVVIAVVGWVNPSSIPLCFQPEQAGQTVVVCPTAQSSRVVPVDETGPNQPEIDKLVRELAESRDVLVVEILGLIAAAVAAAAAVRRIRGSSEPHGLPVALALLKLPTGAVTAVLGLMLMRGGFVPGLSALDTSAQILAWAILFGYAQQLFTRFVDQQADTVLDGVRGARGTVANPVTA